MEIDEVRGRLEKAIEEAGSQLKFAFPNNISQSHISDVLNRSARPSNRLLAALGLEEVVTYRERQPAAAA